MKRKDFPRDSVMNRKETPVPDLLSFNPMAKISAMRQRIDEEAAHSQKRMFPFSAGSGDNLLLDHHFTSMVTWSVLGKKDLVFHTAVESTEHTAPGRNAVLMRSFNVQNVGKGLCQHIRALPPGTYTFSAYVMPYTNIVGTMQKPGIYLQVIDGSEHVLCGSPHLQVCGSKYMRLSCSFTIGQIRDVYVQILLDGLGTVYVNAPQLESGFTVSPYNLLINGNFENEEAGWDIYGGRVTTSTKYNMSSSLALRGEKTEACAVQLLQEHLPADARAVYTLSGRVKICKDEPDNWVCVQLLARMKYDDGTTEAHAAGFDENTKEWQFSSVQFTKSRFKNVQSIEVFCQSEGWGFVYFDNIRLIRDQFTDEHSRIEFAEDSMIGDFS